MGLQGTWSQHSINLGGKISMTLRRSSSSAAFWLGSPVGEGVGLAKFLHETSLNILKKISSRFMNEHGGFFHWYPPKIRIYG